MLATWQTTSQAYRDLDQVQGGAWLMLFISPQNQYSMN